MLSKNRLLNWGFHYDYTGCLVDRDLTHCIYQAKMDNSECSSGDTLFIINRLMGRSIDEEILVIF